MKTYIVVTIVRIGENDLFGDIILVTSDKKQAKIAKRQVKERKHLPGLDYNLLQPYDDVIFFERELNEVIQNTEEDDIEDEVA